jgi:hypothetical protein
MKKLISLVVILVVAALAWGQPAAAIPAVDPIFVDDNPDCTDLGFAHGLKFDYSDGELPGTYPLGSGTVTWSTDGTYVDWSSTFGVDAVIMKGGPNANVYKYDPPAESFGDTGLVSPINDSNKPDDPNGDKPYGLSHVEFCFDYELEVSKTAVTSFTRTYTWDIDKSVTPAHWDFFLGGSGESEYTINVTKGHVDSDWAVEGEITIHNPDPTLKALVETVEDVISGGIAAEVKCPVTLPYELAAGGTLVCDYSADLPDATTRTNTATVTTCTDDPEKPYYVGGGSGTAEVKFGAPTKIEGYEKVTVEDTNGKSWDFSESRSETYKMPFNCDCEGENKNVATIKETGDWDDAIVTVKCHKLDVWKDAKTSFKRTYHWTIDKVGDKSEAMLSVGQSIMVNYDVTVAATYTDSDWAVSGKIEVKNPAPIAAKLTKVEDMVSPDLAAVVDCKVTFPYILPAGETLTCTYTKALPDATARTNTATAYWEYDKASYPADVKFDNATKVEVDECIYVTDDKGGVLGPVCYSDLPKTFEYTLLVGPYAECGMYDFVNIASFLTNDTSTKGSDSWTVHVNVPCEGCTLTPGYWKTHSIYGPASKPDDAWYNLGELGPDTIFFLSGQTYYQVLWTNPAGGNAYYILAHAYIAAKLNILDGAGTTPEVLEAVTWAESFFATHAPTDALDKKERAKVVRYAGILDQYNNGIIGPGHCTE